MGKKCAHLILFALTVQAVSIGYSSPAIAESELTSPVVDTGQSECYDNYRRITCPSKGRRFYGQDAQYDGLQMSYRDNGDGTVTDLNTGLMWQKTPSAEHYSWDDATGYASDLQLAGHDDWRQLLRSLYMFRAGVLGVAVAGRAYERSWLRRPAKRSQSRQPGEIQPGTRPPGRRNQNLQLRPMRA